MYVEYSISATYWTGKISSEKIILQIKHDKIKLTIAETKLLLDRLARELYSYPTAGGIDGHPMVGTSQTSNQK